MEYYVGDNLSLTYFVNGFCCWDLCLASDDVPRSKGASPWAVTWRMWGSVTRLAVQMVPAMWWGGLPAVEEGQAESVQSWSTKREGRAVPMNLSSPCCLGYPYSPGPGVGVCVAEPSEAFVETLSRLCAWGAELPAVPGPAGGDAPARDGLLPGLYSTFWI